MSNVFKHICCPHCAGVIFFTGRIDPTKDNLENSKVPYKEKTDHTQQMRSRATVTITHEQAENIFAGLWKTLFKTQRKHAPNRAWVWWRK